MPLLLLLLLLLPLLRLRLLPLIVVVVVVVAVAVVVTVVVVDYKLESIVPCLGLTPWRSRVTLTSSTGSPKTIQQYGYE